eukprot:3303076-Pyramimonas_sp.AAC.1
MGRPMAGQCCEPSCARQLQPRLSALSLCGMAARSSCFSRSLVTMLNPPRCGILTRWSSGSATCAVG